MRVTVFLALFICFIAVAAQAATITAPQQALPGQPAAVSGSGFGASEAVDVYLDTTDNKLFGTDASGAFSGSIFIPASIKPGQHTVTAVGRTSGDTAQTPILVTAPWREVGLGLGHSGWNPYERTLTKSTAPNLARKWANSTLVSNGTEPAAVYPKVYVTARSGVGALDAATGAIAWSTLLDQHFTVTPTVYDRVYVGSTTGVVYALDLATGTTVWSRKVGNEFFGSLALAGRSLYVGNHPGFSNYCPCMYALNADTGATRWTYAAGVSIDTTPVVVNDVVYFSGTGQSSATVQALDAATGARIWAKGIVVFNNIFSPIVANGIVYVASDSGEVLAINAETGQLRWSTTTAQWIEASPAFAQGIVYVGAGDGGVYALDALTGALRWKTTPPFPLETRYASGATVANGVVYVFLHSQDQKTNILYALDASSGAILGTYPVEIGARQGPSISDGVLYVNGVAVNSKRIFAMAPRAAGAAPTKPSELHPDRSLAVSK